MKTLSRYVLREHFGPLAFSFTALTSLLLLNFIAKRFGDLVGKGLPWTVIIEFFLLAIPFTLAMTLPMAVLVSVLYAFSRLAAESEITALKASGVGMWSVLRPVLLAATVIAAGMVFFNDQLLPRANHRLRTLQTDIGRTKPTFALRPQVINDVVPGRLSLRAARIDQSTNRMYEVTIFDFGDVTKRRTIVADSGDLALAASGDLRLTLWNGEMTELPPNEPGRMSRLRYVQDVIVVRGVANSFMRDTTDNFKSEREMGVCEMQAQVNQAERDLAREREQVGAQLRRATRALTRGTIDSLAPFRDTAAKPFSIGRAYCDGAAAVARLLGRGGAPGTGAPPADSADAGRPVDPQLPVQAQFGDTAQRTVPAGAATAASPGPRPPGGAALPAAVYEMAPGNVAAGLGVVLDQSNLRLQSARAVSAQYAVEVHKKFSLAAACVVFVLLGAPIALRFPRGGVGLVIGASLVVFALYYVCLIGGESLADDLKVAPWLAMWAANALFTVVGVLLFARMGKEGTTARGGDLGELKEALVGWVQKLRRGRGGAPSPRTA